ncbi:MAG: signal peptidase I [Planctomycetes bacterium]|nr:signal peptidase I [Planctomycetota bacterium]
MPAPANVESSNTASAPLPAADALAGPLPSSTPRVETWVPPATAANAPVIELPWRPARRLPAPRGATPRLVLRSLWTSAKIGAVLFVAYGLMFNFSVVRGSSMAPGIHDGDRILVDHLSYVFQDVTRGDIVVLQYPLDPSLDYIKRVIGLPGDRVAIHAGGVWVNGQRLTEPYVAEQDLRARCNVVVEPEHYFVLGDNRPHSSDSREFGQVPRANLRGKVEVRVWPPERIGVLD